MGGLIGLMLLGAAYLATLERVPRIRILWRDGVTAEQQAALEARYLLRNARDRLPEGSLAYDLLDTSRANIRALVDDPAVTDSNDIDRDAYVVEPETDRGEAWMWVAYRVPGLRAAGVRWTLILLLSIAAVAGLRREAVWLLRQAGAGLRYAIRAWNAHQRSPADSRDVFDAISFRARSDGHPRRGDLLVKLAAAVLLLPAAGPPVLETWEALALAAALFVIVCGTCRRGWWRIPVAAAVVLATLGVKGALPRADIAEGHNSFLLPEDGGPLEQGLPPEVFANWKAQFDALYPEPEVVVANSWRALQAGPESLYVRSSDAIWRPAKYTRQVDTVNFRTLAAFRGGFANKLDENFWAGDLVREDMPFYVMYELTPASVGSRLRWTGQVFWEGSDGRYEEIRHDRVGERTIEPRDIGKRVYAVFFPGQQREFEFRLVPSRTLRLAGWAEALLTLVGLCAVALTIRPRWSAYLRTVSLFLVAYYIVIAGFPEPSSARLGKSYLPHGTSSDGGLGYEVHGRTMAILVGSGRVVEALQGTEPVFASTPGMRYVRMVEKLVFGDTNHLLALLIAAVPIVVFSLMRRFIGALPAWVVTAGFVGLPLQHFSFLQYVTNGRTGSADGIGAGVFLLGLTLVLHHEPATTQRRLAYVYAGGAALAAAMCLRPHIGLAAAWVASVYAGRSWARKDLPAAFALAAGVSLALWVPLHNWYYGGELNLATRREAASLADASWQDLLRAPVDVFRGRLDSGAVASARQQITTWLWSPVFSYSPSSSALQWPERTLRVAALVVTMWVAFAWAARRQRAPADLALVAGAALWAHAAMLVVAGLTQRYLLAWDLSVVVLIIWVLRRSGADVGATSPARERAAADAR
ncbi:MAG: hypothetical protein A3I61_19450 [Acidobacteria bacterium RIFCSPLOWO2_02_FULL_68_18]|nr:MAG: hypothetical protein A3I61_19450 [Acidobacteria bacterium RIFCSPLOWO2_02_FULL_68_18]OFW49951.1 MAG: hypothetical protein A3G77_08505 [Acidobacteria bacterium RIFCSPLOWO2_12_FULL_68_19]